MLHAQAVGLGLIDGVSDMQALISCSLKQRLFRNQTDASHAAPALKVYLSHAAFCGRTHWRAS